jgi:hypothetical protein
MPTSLQQMRYKHEKNKQLSYNRSFLISPKENESDYMAQAWDKKWYHAPIAQVYENMREFELAHEMDAAPPTLYTDEYEYPDHYNHHLFLRQQQQKRETEELHDKQRTKSPLWKKLDAVRGKLMEMKA